LAGQTAIYGLPSILGRLLNYFLVPFYTRVLAEGEFGSFSVMYSYTGILIVVLTYGMETAYFRYAAKCENHPNVYSSTFLSIFSTSLLFVAVAQLFPSTIASWIDYADHPEYVRWFGIIIGVDALISIPFAYLRQQGKAKRFAVIRFSNIVINIGLNLFFILFCPYILKMEGDSFLKSAIGSFFNTNDLVSYVFISNLIASVCSMVLLFPEIIKGFGKFDVAIWKKLIAFGLPMLLVGLSGNINENIDKLMLRYILPGDIAEAQVGIYAACYKISILMTLFNQAYRYAAEPFFFSYAENRDSKNVYALLLNYFVIIVGALYLITMLFLDVLILFIGPNFRSGQAVVPVLMLGLLFLGVYYNLSVWYKLTDKPLYGAIISIIGSVITIVINAVTIPLIGYMGSAWATLICYASMMVISYFWGQKHFPVKYNFKKFFLYVGSAVGFYLFSLLFANLNLYLHLAINAGLFLIYILLVIKVEKVALTNVKNMFRKE
jgi:O-antigen/teichoic acid export membrane protein